MKSSAAKTQELAIAEFEKLTLTQQRAAVFSVQAGRETIESFAVAFILALLFRAFIAEAFVIPTGSMAPALMGAHKDLFCQQCGEQFPVGASSENRGDVTDAVVVGGICPNCRYANPLDLVNNDAHGTFNGDRILVSKFAYMVKDPKRWDVIVFKVPVNPKQNYIKRLVGLPNETLSLRHGDVFVRPTGSPDPATGDDQPMIGGDRPRVKLGEILRKPPVTLLAMKHFVYDSDHQPAKLLAAKYPSRLQPWRPGAETPPADSWKVDESESGLVATIDGALGGTPNAANGDATTESENWLRYYHHWALPQQWAAASKGLSLANVDPYSGRLVSDFHAYDSYAMVRAFLVYASKPAQSNVSWLGKLLGKNRAGGEYRSSYKSGEDLAQFGDDLVVGTNGLGYDGVHWVGDLIATTDIETAGDAKTLTLETVEAGVRYQWVFDLMDGKCELKIVDGRSTPSKPLAFAAGQPNPVAMTNVRAGRRHQIRWSNCDEQILLWVDDEIVEFDRPTTFEVAEFTNQSQERPYYDGPGNPLDASPLGLSVVGGGATVRRFQIDRDKHYIAVDTDRNGIVEYDLRKISEAFGENVPLGEVQLVLGQPEIWDKFPGWKFRRSVTFELGEEQYFPMGDNSPESLDARAWAGTKKAERFGIPPSPDDDAYLYADASYVPRDLLVGKALMVFWPHPWNDPVPMTPNFKRIKLIR